MLTIKKLVSNVVFKLILYCIVYYALVVDWYLVNEDSLGDSYIKYRLIFDAVAVLGVIIAIYNTCPMKSKISKTIYWILNGIALFVITIAITFLSLTLHSQKFKDVLSRVISGKRAFTSI